MAGTRISRKTFLKYIAAGLGAVTAAPYVRSSGAAPGDRPNVLFMCMDQLSSWIHLPKALPLPAHEKLLSEGVGFKNYHVTQSPCGPSRAVIFTGQHSQRTGVYANATYKRLPEGYDGPPSVALQPGFPTIGSMLRATGYYTAYKGKWHLSNIAQTLPYAPNIFPNAEEALEPFGFSDYSFNGEHIGLTWGGHLNDGVIAADTVNLIRHFGDGGTDGKPWFLAVNFINPHDIMFYDATGVQAETRSRRNLIGSVKPEPGAALYDSEWDFPLPQSFHDDLSRKPGQQLRSRARSNRSFGQMPLEEPVWKKYRNYYFNCIRDVDRHIMSVLKALETSGQAENTIVVMTSDHGEMAGAHGLRGKSASLYKENLNVPLIIRHPDVQGGRSANTLASAVDLVPTLLAMTGMSAAERAVLNPDLPGVDLSATLSDPAMTTERDRRGALFNFVSFGGLQPGERGESAKPDLPRSLLRGVFDGRYKFGRYFSPTEHHMPRDWETLVAHNDIELYDTESDPHEMNNLAFQPDGAKAHIMRLSTQVNSLIQTEIGNDNGAMYPGDFEDYIL